MAGTQMGGQKAAATNKAKYGSDFYRRIGAQGGAASGTGGFYHAKLQGREDFIREAGRRGGTISRRPKKIPNPKVRLRVDNQLGGSVNG
jgi:general stress protein YciG